MKLATGESFFDLLRQIMDNETSYVHNRLRSLGVTNMQARLLQYISDHPGSLQKELAVALNRQEATVTNMLKTMEQRGYVLRRIPADNERQKRLYLEPAGQEVAAKITGIFTDLEQLLLKSVPEQQQGLLAKQLREISICVKENTH